MSDNTPNPVFKTAKLEVVEKRMKAFLILKDVPPDQGKPLTFQFIMDLLDTAGVKFGINREVIQDIVDGKINDDRVLIAEGKNPQVGTDAQIELFFSNEKSLKPQTTEDGHIDYKEVNMICSIEKDKPLAKKIISTTGAPGMDVYGVDIPGLYGKDFEFIPGPGTYRDQTETTLIKAGMDGVIFYDPKTYKIEVQKIFIIPESVDYSTGNIHVKSSIEIKQHVKPGFSVETPYNIEVKGGIEQALITCGGTLKVKEGINGDGKQLIKVGEDIHAGYLANTIIKCGGSVYSSSEIRNSIIECDNEIALVKSTGVLIGGKSIATNKITSPVIGNSYNITTEVEVGIQLKHREKYLKKKTEEMEIIKQIEELKKQISYIAQKPDNNAKKMMLANFKEIWQKSTALLEKAKKDVQEIEIAYYDVSNPTVCVPDIVYPGTIIRIKNKSFEVKDPLKRVMFKIDKEEIVAGPIK